MVNYRLKIISYKIDKYRQPPGYSNDWSTWRLSLDPLILTVVEKKQGNITNE